MASTPLSEVLQFSGSSSQYYMPIPASRGDGSLLGFLRQSREALGIPVPGKAPGLADDPFYPEVRQAAEWLCSLPPGTAMINGDYDVDGCTSTVIAWKMLRTLGWSVRLFTPDRIEDHYGVNVKILKSQIQQEKIDLVMTVDCGSASLRDLDELSAAHGLKTLVVDHHQRMDAPEKTSAQEINPHKHPAILKELGTSNPYCAAVLTYMLMSHVAEIRPEMRRLLPEAAILAGMAGIADVANMGAPATRHCGIEFLNKACEPGTNPGLGVLMQKLKVTTDRLDTSTAAFSVIPVLNAANRMANANMVIDLLTQSDPATLDTICVKLIALNKECCKVQDKIEAEALAQVTARGIHSSRLSCILEYNNTWPIGVIGSAAGRIAQDQQTVTILGGPNPKNGEITFSARVPMGSGVDALYYFAQAVGSLSPEEQRKIKFGGHNAAFGARLAAPDAVLLLDRVRRHMERALKKADAIKPMARLLDCKLGTQIAPQALESLRPLEPYGEGNPEPRFLVENVRLSLRPTFKSPTTFTGTALDRDSKKIDVLVFNFNNVLAANHSTVNLVGRLMADKTSTVPGGRLILKVEDVISPDDPIRRLEPSQMPGRSLAGR